MCLSVCCGCILAKANNTPLLYRFYELKEDFFFFTICFLILVDIIPRRKSKKIYGKVNLSFHSVLFVRWGNIPL